MGRVARTGKRFGFFPSPILIVTVVNADNSSTFCSHYLMCESGLNATNKRTDGLASETDTYLWPILVERFDDVCRASCDQAATALRTAQAGLQDWVALKGMCDPMTQPLDHDPVSRILNKLTVDMQTAHEDLETFRHICLSHIQALEVQERSTREDLDLAIATSLNNQILLFRELDNTLDTCLEQGPDKTTEPYFVFELLRLVRSREQCKRQLDAREHLETADGLPADLQNALSEILLEEGIFWSHAEPGFEETWSAYYGKLAKMYNMNQTSISPQPNLNSHFWPLSAAQQAEPGQILSIAFGTDGGLLLQGVLDHIESIRAACLRSKADAQAQLSNRLSPLFSAFEGTERSAFEMLWSYDWLQSILEVAERTNRAEKNAQELLQSSEDLWVAIDQQSTGDKESALAELDQQERYFGTSTATSLIRQRVELDYEAVNHEPYRNYLNAIAYIDDRTIFPTLRDPLKDESTEARIERMKEWVGPVGECIVLHDVARDERAFSDIPWSDEELKPVKELVEKTREAKMTHSEDMKRRFDTWRSDVVAQLPSVSNDIMERLGNNPYLQSVAMEMGSLCESHNTDRTSRKRLIDEAN